MNEVQDLLIVYLPIAAKFLANILYALLIFVLGKWVIGRLINVMKLTLERRDMDKTVIRFIENLTYYLLLALLLVVVLTQLGVETASLIAVLGAAGLAVGLALQGSLSNFASGVLLIMLRPCKIGDYVEAGGSAGVVEAIDILATTLVTPDNKTVMIPNSHIMSGPIVNFSAKDKRRVDLVVGVAYGTDLDKARSVLIGLLEADSRVLAEPNFNVQVHTLADSSINFIVRPWVASADYWPVYYDMQKGIVKAFEANDIEIPFPQLTMHMHRSGAEE